MLWVTLLHGSESTCVCDASERVRKSCRKVSGKLVDSIADYRVSDCHLSIWCIKLEKALFFFFPIFFWFVLKFLSL